MKEHLQDGNNFEVLTQTTITLKSVHLTAATERSKTISPHEKIAPIRVFFSKQMQIFARFL